MVYCPNCGKPVETRWNSCPFCRTDLQDEFPNYEREAIISRTTNQTNMTRNVPKSFSFDTKSILIIAISFLLIFSLIGNVLLNIRAVSSNTPPDFHTLVVGVGDGPVTIDPIDSWDSASNDVLMQVTETLFWYDLTDPNLPLEPLLAKSYEWMSDTRLYLELREFVWFHDYQKLDAEAVKWNVDRWLYFTNSTGELPPTAIPAFPSSLYFLSNDNPTILNCTVHGEYNLSIYLTEPFGPFLSLLSYTSCSIIAPDENYQTKYIGLTTGDLVGTGPFMLDIYRVNIEVRFSRWDGYWRHGAYYEVLIFTVIEETSTRNAAMQTGDIDILFGADPTLIDTFIADPDIHVEDAGAGFAYWYLAFQTQKVNRTWRKALSLCYNYSYVVEVIKLGNALRGCPAVPRGMPGHNASVQTYLDTHSLLNTTYIEEARTIMQSMGFGYDGPGLTNPWDVSFNGIDEADWTSASFRTFDFFCGYLSAGTNFLLIDLTTFNWMLLGIDVHAMEYDPWDPHEDAEILFGVWGPDYMDGFNMLDPLFSPYSQSNFAQVDIPIVNELLENASKETDNEKRFAIYERLQYILFEKEYVHMPLWAPIQRFVHSENIKGHLYNFMNQFYAWQLYFSD